MKKVIALVLMVAMVLSLSACGSLSAITEKIKEAKELGEQIEEVTGEGKTDGMSPEELDDARKSLEDTLGEFLDGIDSDIKDGGEVINNSCMERAEPEVWFADSTFEIADADKIIVDEQNVKITIQDVVFDYDYEYLRLDIFIENNSEYSLSARVVDAAVNGCMVDTLVWEELDAGKKMYSEIEIDLEEMMDYNIYDIYSLYLTSRISLNDKVSYIGTLIDSVNAPSSNYKTVLNYEGTVVYDANDIKIVHKGMYNTDDNEIESAFYIENNGSKIAVVDIDNLSANDFMVDGYISVEVAPGCCAVDSFEIDEDEMQDIQVNNVYDVTLIGFDIDIDTVDWDDIDSVDDIEIAINY